MAKGRSPNCPTITLREALDRGRKVYAEEHTHPADRKVIAEDLGYSGLSGASATMIGALRQYGVLEGRGEGLRISDDAVTAFEMPVGSPEYSEAVKRLAFQPALFGELHSQYGDRLPGEANLRHLLIKKGFLPDTADDAIRTYRDNLELVGGTQQEYNKAEAGAMPTQEATEAKTGGFRKIAETVLYGGVDPATLQARSYAFDISIPRHVKGELKIVGQFGKEDLERLKKALNGQLAMIEAALED